MPEPSVSVVVPARAVERFLPEAVASVLAQPETAQLVIGTFYADSETAQWAATHPDPRVELAISSYNSAGGNTQAGVTATTGAFVAFLDADDRWPQGRLAPALRALAGPPAAGLCLGQQQAMDESGELLAHIAPAPLMSAAVATRATVEQIGAFGTDLTAQMRWLVRARDLEIPTVVLDEVVMHRRGHRSNLSTVQKPELHQAYLKLARERARAARGGSGPTDEQGRA